MENCSTVSKPNDCSAVRIIDALMQYRRTSNEPLCEKFCIEYIILQFDRLKLERLESYYKCSKQSGMGLLDFTRLLLNILEHTQEEVVYLVSAIMDLFEEVCSINATKQIRFDHLTNYLCQRIFNHRYEQPGIKTRLLPQNLHLSPVRDVRLVDVKAPVIHGETQECLSKLAQNRKLRTDRYKHFGIIKCAAYEPKSECILALDTLSDFIGIYDLNCVMVRRLTPTLSKIKKENNILWFAYSRKQERVGAILKDYSIVFWDLKVQDSEKMFSTSDCCTDFQSCIWYLEEHDMWLTGGQSGRLYIWDINEEAPKTCLKLEREGKVTDLCELPCVGLIALSQEHCSELPALGHKFEFGKEQHMKRKSNSKSSGANLYSLSLYNLQKGCKISELSLSSRQIQNIMFSARYQVLLCCACDTKIDVLEVNPQYFDISVKGKLVGHESVINTFTVVEETPMVVSADDKGKIKIWDLRSYKCIQTIDLGDQTLIVKLVDLMSVNMLAFTGSRLTLMEFDARSQRQLKSVNQQARYPVHIDYQMSAGQLVVFTRKDIRVCDINVGTIKHIYSCSLASEEEIVAGKYVPHLKQFIVCNDRGEIKVYSSFDGRLICNLIGHSAEVSEICYDFANSLYISASWDSDVIIQKQSAQDSFREVRLLSNNFNCKEITCMAIESRHSLLAVGSTAEGSVNFWDYQLAKVLGGITLGADEEPASLAFVHGYPLIIIGTNLCRLYFVKLERAEAYLLTHLLAIVDLKEELNEDTFARQLIKLQGTTSKDFQHTILKDCELMVGSSSGKLIEINLTEFINEQTEKATEPVFTQHSQKSAHIFDTLLKENFSVEVTKKLFRTTRITSQPPTSQIYPNLVKWYSAHEGSITSLASVGAGRNHTVSAGVDGFIKIWQKGGILLSSWNINKPLPYRWDFREDRETPKRKKLVLSLKLIRALLIQYCESLSKSEENLLRIDGFLDKIKSIAMDDTIREEPRDSVAVKAHLLQDQLTTEQSQQDTNFHRYSRKRGPTLKEMNQERRVKLIQRMLREGHPSNSNLTADTAHQHSISTALKEMKNNEYDRLTRDLQQSSEATKAPAFINENVLKFMKRLNENRKVQTNAAKENVRNNQTKEAVLLRGRKHRHPSTTYEQYFKDQNYRASLSSFAQDSSSATPSRLRKRLFEDMLKSLDRKVVDSKKRMPAAQDNICEVSRSSSTQHREGLFLTRITTSGSCFDSIQR